MKRQQEYLRNLSRKCLEMNVLLKIVGCICYCIFKLLLLTNKQINHKRRALFSYGARYVVIEFSDCRTKDQAKLCCFVQFETKWRHTVL